MENKIDTMRLTVTNKGVSPRGVNTTTGVLVVLPGQTSREVVMTLPEIESVRASGGFSFEEIGKGPPMVRMQNVVRKSKLGMEIESLRVQVADLKARLGEVPEKEPEKEPEKKKEEDGAVSSGSTDEPKTAAEILKMAEDKSVEYNDFRAEAQKLLGPDLPKKKVDIVAALEEIATK